MFNALNALTSDDLNKIIYIRNQGHTVMEAINRQLAHYPYHVGQILVLIGKMLTGDQWKSLSIPRGDSKTYNADKFSEPKHRGHFTDDYLDDNIGSNKPHSCIVLSFASLYFSCLTRFEFISVDNV
ncbi:MAG: DUF1572 family protein [Chryseolinea sp.]